jgi:hypothetical protein
MTRLLLDIQSSLAKATTPSTPSTPGVVVEVNEARMMKDKILG